MRTVSLTLSVCLLNASCTVHRTMRMDFYSPAPLPAPESRPRVTVSVPSKVRSEPADPWSGLVTAVVATDPAFSSALRDALCGAFELVPEGGTADFHVAVSTGFPEEVGLEFRDAASGPPIRVFRKPGVAWELDSTTMKVLPFFSFLLVPLLLLPALAPSAGNAGRRQVERELAAALDALMAEIREDAALLSYPALRRRLEADLSRAERAAAAGDAAGAMAGFERAYREAPAGSGLGMSVRTRGLSALGALGAAPPVPEEAVRLAAHARAILQRGEDESAYGAAIAKMEEALALAPWWTDGYFNLGLIQETAKRPAEAIASLKLYLLAAPRSDDAAAVREKIYELEMVLGGSPRHRGD